MRINVHSFYENLQHHIEVLVGWKEKQIVSALLSDQGCQCFRQLLYWFPIAFYRVWIFGQNRHQAVFLGNGEGKSISIVDSDSPLLF
jgi:hypothetical protein